MLLDLEAKDMNQTLYALVEELNLAGLLEDELKGEVLRILLYKYVHIYIFFKFSCLFTFDPKKNTLKYF